MAFKLTTTAKNDIREISLYLFQHYPNKQHSTYAEIRKTILNIVQFPEVGKRDENKPERRSVRIPKLPYYIIYQFDGSLVYILRIYHTSRQTLH